MPRISHQEFRTQLWRWFKKWKRTLPWRDLKVKDQTQRAYMVLASEMMLQQTQVPRVEIIFRRFLREFPTIRHLAKATNRQVILAWRGLGYNSRALRLRDAAKAIITEHGGTFPQTYGDIVAIKGIGPYTAAAILNFAFNIPTPCLDTNIRRILHRVFVGPEKRDGTWRKNDRALMSIAVRLLPLHATSSSSGSLLHPPAPSSSGGRGEHGEEHKQQTFPSSEGGGVRGGGNKQGGDKGGGEWHAALMDFGSLVCTKRVPKCGSCPLGKNNLCRSAGRVKISLHVPKAKESGRVIAGKFVPNRIIRGRIVEYLRDRHDATLRQIGANVCIDWDVREHRVWLRGILQKLARDGMVKTMRGTYTLA